MAEGSHITINLEASLVPIIDDAKALAEMGIIPAGAYKNRAFCKGKITNANVVSEMIEDLLYDPQTSGGLLIAIPESDSDLFIESLKSKYDLPVSKIGYVSERKDTALILY
jgi:Selenophosphate synthase